MSTPPRRPARWTWRIPRGVFVALLVIAVGGLVGFGRYARYDLHSRGECRSCLRRCTTDSVGVDFFGHRQVVLWTTSEWGEVTRVASELAGPDHEHDPVYSSFSGWSRYGGVDGSGIRLSSPVAREFEQDAEFRARVLEVVRDGTVSRECAMLAASAENGLFREDSAAERRAVVAAHELLQACYGDAWEEHDLASALAWDADVLWGADFRLTPDDAGPSGE